MVTAQIKINGTAGNNDNLSVGVSVTLQSAYSGTTYFWQFVSTPPGSSASITNPASQTASFTPDVVGSYLIRLTVTDALGSNTDEVIGAVLTPNLNLRIPAVGEENEFDPLQGWGEAFHTALISLDSAAGGPHAIGGSRHSSSTLASLNNKISDATLDDSSSSRTPIIHGISSAYHSNTTLASLNSKISDATLDDSSDSRTPTGSASGDLSGSYPSPDVVKIRGQSVSGAGPSNNDVLMFSGSQWVPTNISSLTGNTLDQAYDEGGSGAGRSITADSGAIVINASGGNALEIDGYLNLSEISSPSALANKGFIYVKDDSGDTELFYMDNSGNDVQITKDGSISVSLTGNTLDGAYDQGGSGLGRFISADSGPVSITVGADNVGLEIDSTSFSNYSSNALHVASKAGVANVEGALIDFNADGFNNSMGLQVNLSSGTLTSGRIASAFSAILGGASAQVGSDVIGFYGSASSASSGRQIGSKFVGSHWNMVLYGESGQIRLDDGYLALGEISDPTELSNMGILYVKDDSGDTELYYRDPAGNSVKITEDGVVNASGAGNKLGQAYNQGGPGFGRTIIADSGPVFFDYDGYEVARINGVLSFDAQDLIPLPRTNAGYLYSSIDEYNAELFYIDNYNHLTQITDNGKLNLAELDLKNYATKTLLDAYLTYTDIDGYSLTSYVNSQDALKLDKTTADAYLTYTDIDGYSLTSYVNSQDALKLDKTTADAYLTYTDIDGYALTSYVSSQDALKLDKSTADAYLTYTDIDGYALENYVNSHINDTLNPHNVSLSQAYDAGGSGTGRTISASSGPVIIDSSGNSSLELDGYLVLGEVSTPQGLSNSSIAYAQDVDGYSELFIEDNYGNVAQITKRGFIYSLLPTYTVSNLPSASPAGQMIYVSDETGGAVVAFSDGSNWLRVTDRNVVS